MEHLQVGNGDKSHTHLACCWSSSVTAQGKTHCSSQHDPPGLSSCTSWCKLKRITPATKNTKVVWACPSPSLKMICCATAMSYSTEGAEHQHAIEEAAPQWHHDSDQVVQARMWGIPIPTPNPRFLPGQVQVNPVHIYWPADRECHHYSLGNLLCQRHGPAASELGVVCCSR